MFAPFTPESPPPLPGVASPPIAVAASPVTPEDAFLAPGCFTPSQEVAAASLAAGQTRRDVGKLVGVHERTVGRWLEERDFRRYVDRIRGEAIKAAMGRLSDGMVKSAEALLRLVEHSDPHVAFKAAHAVITLGVKMEEVFAIAERVGELEARFDGPSSGDHSTIV